MRYAIIPGKDVDGDRQAERVAAESRWVVRTGAGVELCIPPEVASRTRRLPNGEENIRLTAKFPLSEDGPRRYRGAIDG